MQAAKPGLPAQQENGGRYLTARMGVVAKLLNGRYRPAERSWIKIKNRDYWRYELVLSQSDVNANSSNVAGVLRFLNRSLGNHMFGGRRQPRRTTQKPCGRPSLSSRA